MTVPTFGRVQLKIMQTLWKRGKATAREITDDLSRKEKIAHSTVQTLLRKLEAKGAIAHEVKGRTFVFYSLVEKDKVTISTTREFIKGMFAGSAYGLVAHLLKHEKVASKELARIRRLLEKEEEEV